MHAITGLSVPQMVSRYRGAPFVYTGFPPCRLLIDGGQDG
jgi:hypothetical protein